jgi:hypothetical protein
MKRYLNLQYDVYKVYRYMDELHGKKQQIKQIYEHTLKILGGAISVVFYRLPFTFIVLPDSVKMANTKNRFLRFIGKCPLHYSSIFSNSFQTSALAPRMAAEPSLNSEGRIFTLFLNIGKR